MTYREFLKSKLVRPMAAELTKCPDLHPALFDFQRNVVEASLLRGRFAEFLDTGLGKTICQLEWARHVPGNVLVLAPLAVAEQTRREGETKLGLDVCHSRDGRARGKITIANYERLHLFDLSQFNAVVLDESSILKSFDGKTKQLLCESFRQYPFRLCCTATPSPNDYTELGNHSDFLGVMDMKDMLARWFTHDSANTAKWRIKGHALQSFWQWVASWAACVEKPSDAGGDDSRFELPPLKVQLNTVEADCTEGVEEGYLFRVASMSATSMHKEKRYSLDHRVERAVQLCADPGFHLVWCETNEESQRLADAFGDRCVEVKGADSIDEKEYRLDAFSRGQVPIMVSKPSICGFGLNWQHCAHQVFVSLSYSYESFYQAVRRSWRFGQKSPVRADVVLSESEMPLWQAVSEKMNAHRQMKDAMKYARLDLGTHHRLKLDYKPTHNGRLPSWLQTAA